MSDNKRNRKYSKLKESQPQKPVILAKRDVGSKHEKNTSGKSGDDQIQPKILLKNKEKSEQPPSTSVPTQISIATRDSNEPSTSQSPSNLSSIQVKERDTPHTAPQSATATGSEQLIAPVPIMNRPIVLVSSANYQVNSNAMKVLMKTNTDFVVVGVVGMQGVGKSTIMNLLACDNFDSYKSTILCDKDGIFPTKIKSGKYSTLPRTESVHMFITRDRMILLDCPPVLCNAYKRDGTTNELDDIKLLILMLTVCHLIIVVQDEYFNLNLIRLIQFAELTRPNQDMNPFLNDYVPNVLFIKNYGNYLDFLHDEQLQMEEMLRNFFNESKLHIYLEHNDKQKRSKEPEPEKRVNYFVFPQIKDCTQTPYHPNLEILFTELRNRVFMSPRNQMYNGNTELTEALWFDLVTTTMMNKSNFFLTLYEDIRRNQRDTKAEMGTEDL